PLRSVHGAEKERWHADAQRAAPEAGRSAEMDTCQYPEPPAGRAARARVHRGPEHADQRPTARGPRRPREYGPRRILSEYHVPPRPQCLLPARLLARGGND